jgi:hypothetical protein
MKFVLPVLLALSLAACSTADVRTSTVRTSEQTVTVIQDAYAMKTTTAVPATAATLSPNQQRLTSSDCAKNFDDTISYLEYLMQQKQLQQQQAQSAL